jgi:hypothetical protein
MNNSDPVHPDKLILYLLIEADGSNSGHTYQWHDKGSIAPISYEEEARKCVHSWRKNAGKYKNCTIVIVNCTDDEISTTTKKTFNHHKVTYVHKPMREALAHKCSWFNVPLVGSWLESQYPDKYLLHIDLDMYCVAEPHVDIMTVPNDFIATVGKYDKDNIHDRRTIDQDYPFNCVTCWVLSNTSEKFYNEWYFEQTFLAEQLKDLPWQEFCDIEEHAVDYMYFNRGKCIHFVDRFMFGPGYTQPESIKTEAELDRVSFIHAHIWQNPGKYTAEYVKLKIAYK